MTEREQDERIGSAYRRLKACNLRVSCLRSKLSEMGRTFSTLAQHIKDDRLIMDGNGELAGSSGPPPFIEIHAITHVRESDFIETVSKLTIAKVDLQEAEEEWKSLS